MNFKYNIQIVIILILLISCSNSKKNEILELNEKMKTSYTKRDIKNTKKYSRMLIELDEDNYVYYKVLMLALKGSKNDSLYYAAKKYVEFVDESDKLTYQLYAFLFDIALSNQNWQMAAKIVDLKKIVVFNEDPKENNYQKMSNNYYYRRMKKIFIEETIEENFTELQIIMYSIFGLDICKLTNRQEPNSILLSEYLSIFDSILDFLSPSIKTEEINNKIEILKRAEKFPEITSGALALYYTNRVYTGKDKQILGKKYQEKYFHIINSKTNLSESAAFHELILNILIAANNNISKNYLNSSQVCNTIIKKIPMSKTKKTYYTSLKIIYLYLEGKYENCIDCLKKEDFSMTFVSEAGHHFYEKENILNKFFILASSYFELGDKEKALDNFKKGKEFLDNSPDFNYDIEEIKKFKKLSKVLEFYNERRGKEN